jgi:hypothetical protein
VVFEAGRTLTLQEREVFKPYFAHIVLEKARIIDGKVPFWLRRDMCAVVLGCRIYLRKGHYQSKTKRGIELLGHELVHVSQYLHGMTIFKYVWSCRYGYYKSVYEIDAYAKGSLIARGFIE